MARNRNELRIARCAYRSLCGIFIFICFLVYLALFSKFRLFKVFYYSGNGAGVQDKDAECCRGVENLELWGDAVRWGTDFKLKASHECCRACKAMCDGSTPCLCDSWVFCGDREKCGPRFGECWLKKQKDPLNPEIKESSADVMWTSGLIFGNGEGFIALETEYGKLHIRLLPDCAPHAVAYILELLEARFCTGCRFYRAEGRGSSWNSEGYHIADAPFGPPFALIQGTLENQGTSFKGFPKEACPPIERGSVAWIGSGPDFLISLAKHDEWKNTYTVFGSLLPEDIEIAEKIAQLPTKKDIWNTVQVAVLEKPVSFSLRRVINHKDL
ncbi:hypothetical protein H6P81_005442 [Aristolochia fimbriata]|uniref:PPIase cyclophilin-type domain-containing protein n=1 Tax=Aristolochia fimbriata TaxID=158543 RepID=A0AAV7EYZ1_ARIFI|nr:hypothetical protein H6P81_005442 [Aristolochia fimbriata]